MTPWPRIQRKGDFDEYKAVLTALFHTAGGRACLDLGCGEAHVTQHFAGSVLVDLVPRLNAKIPVIPMDIRAAPKNAVIAAHGPYSLALLSDSLEHLTKQDGTQLLAQLAKRSWVKAIAVFAPVGPCLRYDESSTDPDVHKSAWHPEEFAELEWEVVEYPSYHRYDGGAIIGAFWAWKWLDAPTPKTHEIYARAHAALT